MRERDANERLLENARILVVDDEILIALDLEAIFRDAGAEVVGPFTTLPAALNAARVETLSAALLDISVGRETTQEVAELLAVRGIPFMFYSGQSLSTAMQAAVRDATVITKPAEEALLLRETARLIGR